MPKRLCVVAMVLGMSSCNHSAMRDGGPPDGGPPDGGPPDGAPVRGDAEGAADSRVLPELVISPRGVVDSIRFRVSYGECSGFCNRELMVDGVCASLTSWTNPPNDTRKVEETLTLDTGVNTKILEAAEQALGNPWEPRYGCPDCADQGTYLLKVTAMGTVRETIIDPDQHPAFFDPLIAAIQPVLTAHPGPKSICALDATHCTPGKVSLVLGLNKDGALEPTWYNDLKHSVFLPGCTTVTFERLEGDTVAWSGPAAYCGWEGYARTLGFTDLTTDLALNVKDKPGTYRATGIYYEGCKPGLPISQAECTSHTSVTSNSITTN